MGCKLDAFLKLSKNCNKNYAKTLNSPCTKVVHGFFAAQGFCKGAPGGPDFGSGGLDPVKVHCSTKAVAASREAQKMRRVVRFERLAICETLM